jgi:hypothetical protein
MAVASALVISRQLLPPGKIFEKGGKHMEDKKIYVIPEVISYTDEDILTELGKVHAMPAPPPVSPIL